MQTVQDIFKQYKVTDAEINRLSAEAKYLAIDCGKKGVIKEMTSDTWNFFDNLSDKVWYSSMDNKQKISLGFQLYELFPSYYHFLTPIYHSVRNKEIIDQAEKEIIWKKFMEYLASENYYADPVGYVLWVDFFEDQTTVRETWQGLLNSLTNQKSLLRLIEQAGPVPFDLKEPVYINLLRDEKHHELILNSLLYSAYDFFGQIDKKKVLDIMAKLKINTASENYRLPKEKIEAKDINPHSKNLN